MNQFSLPNCDVISESVFAAELWYQQQISFHYRIVVMILSSDEPLANQFR
jgi:hypothetical protein